MKRFASRGDRQDRVAFRGLWPRLAAGALICTGAVVAGIPALAPVQPALAQLGGAQTPEEGLVRAIEEKDRDEFDRALANGVLPTARDQIGIPALVHAVETRNAYYVSELLEAGARPDDRPRRRIDGQRDDRTALTRAAELGDTTMVRLLVDAQADLDLPGDQNEPALIKAARAGHFDVVRILVEAGADLEATEMTGRTAAEVARRAGYHNIADMLENADGR